MRSESPIQFSLQTLAEFDRIEDVGFKLREKTFAAIKILATDGLRSPDQSLFLLSAAKLITLISEAEYKKPTIFQPSPDNDDECTCAVEICSQQIGLLSEIIKNKGGDWDLTQRQELSIRIINEMHKHGNEPIKRLTKEAFVRLQPHIIRGMIRGVLNFDEAGYLLLKDFPFTGEFVIKEAQKASKQIPVSEFRPIIKALVAASEPEIRSTGEKLAEVLLTRLGFTKDEINDVTGDSECEPEFIADNIDAIFAIEHSLTGIARWLMHGQGVKHFGRYPTELLLDQLRFIDDRESPWGVILYPDSDYNGAFHESYLSFGKARNQLAEIAVKKGATFRLRIVEGENMLSISKSLIRLYRQYGQISFAIIGGHGDPQGIQFGDKYDISELVKYDLKNGPGLQRGIKKIFKPGANVILTSCLTGKKNGFAQALSKLGLNVVGPEKEDSANDPEIRYRYNKLQIEQTFRHGPHNEYRNGELVVKKKK